MIGHVDTVSPSDSLTRHLGVLDAVVIGLASMIGAGVFAVWVVAQERRGCAGIAQEG
ncbi:MAG: hypothetical protein M3N95_00915 [Actinomycetota bacterium]|nr:hypothetical protein [Actinomycetota bacterium]